MTLVQRSKRTVPAVQILAIGLVAMMTFERLAYGQLSHDERHGQPYRGAATVSIATLQVPEQAWKHFEKARVLAIKHKPAESEQESAKALAIAPRFAAAHLLLASQELLLRQFDDVVANVVAARTTDPDAPWAAVLLAGAYNGMRRFKEALAALDDVSGAEAESWQTKYERARAATGLGDVEEALRWSEETLSIAPRDVIDAILVRANALMLAHRWSEAADQLSAYLATPAPLAHKDEALRALAVSTSRLHAEEPVNLASR